MKEILLTFVLFLSASSIVAGLSYFAVSADVVIKIIAALVLLILVLLVIFSHIIYKKKFRYLLLFLITLTTQMLVVATGGFYSPYLVLIYFFALGISLFFTVNASLFFLISSFGALIGDIILSKTDQNLWNQDPGAVILYSVSFISIIPIAQLLASKYKLKDNFLRLMKKQIAIQESIISEVKEMIFIIDIDNKILAVNDRVEHILGRTREELIGQPVSTILFLRNSEGKLLNNTDLGFDEIKNSKKSKKIDDLIFVPPAAGSVRHVNVVLKPVLNLKGKLEQVSIILHENHLNTQTYKNIEEAESRLGAKIGDLKIKFAKSDPDSLNQIILIERLKNDILLMHSIEDHLVPEKKIYIDIAVLCRAAVSFEQDFAKACGVSLRFELPDFAKDEYAKMITSLIDVKPEDFTGPFFTAKCEVRYVNIAIKKLIEMSVLISAGNENSEVLVQVKRKESNKIVVAIVCKAPEYVVQNHDELFELYYASLIHEAKLNQGSGLEGYLAGRILSELNIPHSIVADQADRTLCFSLSLQKEKSRS